MRPSIPAVPAALAALAGFFPAIVMAQRPARVVVGANVSLSAPVDVHHREFMIAAAPWNPDVLIAGGVQSSGGDTFSTEPFIVGRRNTVWVSTDGGVSWRSTFMSWGSDPQVAAGRRGSLLFAGMRLSTTSSAVDVITSRSTDLGATWSAPVSIGATDHPQITVDYSAGRFKGRVYIAGKGCGDDGKGQPRLSSSLCLWRSDDDGRTWRKPMVFERGTHWREGSVQSTYPLVLSDGTLLLPFVRNYRSNEAVARPGEAGYDRADAVIAVSRDGGETFAQRIIAHTAKEVPPEGPAPGTDPRMSNRPFPLLFPHFAVDTSGHHRDRVHMVWVDHHLQEGATDRLVARYSDDRGKTWSTPVLVDPTGTPGSKQWLPTLAVNKDGVVGIRWLDSRHAPNGWLGSLLNSYHDEYFAVSVDGGRTFLPSVRVSSESSKFDSRFVWLASTTNRGDSALVFTSTANSWSDGDYLGLTADGNGTFWPLWADVRNGVRHLYTAPVWVERGSESDAGVTTTVPVGSFQVELGAIKVDSTGATLEIPIRVRNRSKEPLLAPLRLTVTAMPAGQSLGLMPGDTTATITFLNGERIAAAGSAAGAEFDLGPALRGQQTLAAGQRTAELIVRIKNVTTSDQWATVGTRFAFALNAAKGPSR